MISWIFLTIYLIISAYFAYKGATLMYDSYQAYKAWRADMLAALRLQALLEDEEE